MMLNFVAQIEMDLTQEELENLAALAKQLNQDVPQVARMCMSERCVDLLKTFQQQPSAE